MSIVEADGFADDVAEAVVKVAAAGPQRLPRLSLTECAACHSRVNFRFYNSAPSPDPNFRVVYLRCPVCGARAIQVREVEVLPKRRHVAKVKYRYQG